MPIRDIREYPSTPSIREDGHGGALGSGDGQPDAVSVRDLRVRLTRNKREADVIRGIDMTIGSGEIVGLVGESGSGKSVLGNTLLGLLPEASSPKLWGTADIAGTDMVSADSETRRRCRRDHLGAVFQDPMTSLDPTMKVGNQVIEAAGSSRAALELLEAVHIPQPEATMRRYPHELSGGQRQRVMIAMAVAGNPSLVIADEPTTALDVTVQAQVLRLLADLRDNLGCSILLITHDLGVAAQISNRIAVMYAGRIVEQGPSEDVLHNPAHPYTISLLRSRLSLGTRRDQPLPALPGGAPDPRDIPPGCAFAPRCPRAEILCQHTIPTLGVVGAEHSAACLIPAKKQSLSRDPEQTAADGVSHDGNKPLPAEQSADSGDEQCVIRAKNIVVSFGQRRRLGRRQPPLRVLNGLNLALKEAECLSVVGESGSGKSTLLRVLAGLTPYTGTLERDISAPTQMVFQDSGSSLTPWLTVGSMLDERLRNDGVESKARRARALRALERTGLPHSVYDAHPRELSGGQRQRVALARATVVAPSILLCDEPTSALDVSLAATVLNLIGELRREFAMTVVFVTHDLAVARVVADRIAVMRSGEIIEIGPSENVISHPENPYTQQLLASVPDVGRRIASVTPPDQLTAVDQCSPQGGR